MSRPRTSLESGPLTSTPERRRDPHRRRPGPRRRPGRRTTTSSPGPPVTTSSPSSPMTRRSFPLPAGHAIVSRPALDEHVVARAAVEDIRRHRHRRRRRRGSARHRHRRYRLRRTTTSEPAPPERLSGPSDPVSVSLPGPPSASTGKAVGISGEPEVCDCQIVVLITERDLHGRDARGRTSRRGDLRRRRCSSSGALMTAPRSTMSKSPLAGRDTDISFASPSAAKYATVGPAMLTVEPTATVGESAIAMTQNTSAPPMRPIRPRRCARLSMPPGGDSIPAGWARVSNFEHERG